MEEGKIDFASEGLLDGFEGAERAERVVLLEQLAADGVPLAELRRATNSGTLMFLPADRVIVGNDRYTSLQVAELSGVTRRARTKLPSGGGELSDAASCGVSGSLPKSRGCWSSAK